LIPPTTPLLRGIRHPSQPSWAILLTGIYLLPIPPLMEQQHVSMHNLFKFAWDLHTILVTGTEVIWSVAWRVWRDNK
jgi:hypothetical protein